MANKKYRKNGEKPYGGKKIKIIFTSVFFIFFILLLSIIVRSETPPVQVWSVAGPSGTAYGTAADNNGNVYVTGISSDNYYTIKYNAINNATIWSASYDSGSSDTAYGIAVDSSGGVYVGGQNLYTGMFTGDYYIIKYNSSGQHVWNASYSGVFTDVLYGIAADNLGFVYVTGLSGNYYTIKYNATNGTQIWNATGSPGTAYGIAADSSGNIYVTGQSNFNFFTMKYNSTGGNLWNVTGPAGTAYAVASDSSNGVIYVTGTYNSNYYTIKYNATNGSQIWSATYDGGGTDTGRGIALDISGNIYVTGDANGKYTTVKYNSTGGYQWNITNVTGTAYGIAVDNENYAYVTGISGGKYYTVKYNSIGGSDTTSPSVYLLNPPNAESTSSQAIWFGANAIDDINVTNMTLYIWNSTNSLINTTVNSSCSLTPLSCITNISVALSYSDTYKWNYYACGNSSNCAWNSSNFSLVYNDIPNINVIIVDSSDTRTVGFDTDYGIPGKTVTFPLVTAGGIYATNVTNTTASPHPFLIRNVGSDNSNISIFADSYILTSPTSKIEFWAQPGRPQSGGSENWDKVDNCAGLCYDSTKTPYTGDAVASFCNNNPTGCCASPTNCLAISSIQGAGNQKVMIYKLSSSVLTNEAFLHVKVSVGSSESSGAKSGTINIVGSYTT